jgi:hypothetical protein
MTQRTELPALTERQFDVLRRFAMFKANTEEVRYALAGVFEFDLEPERRTASSHFRVPEPGIVVTRDHISNALEREQNGSISHRELIDWATMLLLNDAYQPDPKDEDFVAEWLNRISQVFDPT